MLTYVSYLMLDRTPNFNNLEIYLRRRLLLITRSIFLKVASKQ